MPKLDTYLIFDGTTRDAMRFYEKTLGGKLEIMMTHAESPMKEHCSAANADRIMHACLNIDGRLLMASDSMAEQPYEGMHGIALTIDYPTVAEAERAFAALSDGGKVNMPPSPTFWAESFSMVVDRFGTSWMISGAPLKF